MFPLVINKDLKLALVEPAFAKDYYAIVSRQRDYLSQWLGWVSRANDEAFFSAFINQSLHDYLAGKSLTCAMIYRDEVVGNISFNRILPALKKVEVGYWLRQDFQGKGIVSQSVSALVDYAFAPSKAGGLGMDVVQIATAVNNEPSQRVCKRLGFAFCGIVPHAENVDGRIVDHAIYTLKKFNRST